MDASLIIPTFNRANQLSATLDSISKQSDLSNIEVIVIDNGSTDNTKEVIFSYSEKIANLIYEYDATPGLLTGRHRGIELAKSEILCFLDDDVLLNNDYTFHLKRIFVQQDIHFATGPCLPKFEVDPPAWLNYFWIYVEAGKFCSWLSLIDLGEKQRLISPMFVFGLNFCGRKSSIQQLGGFHPDCIPEGLQKYQGDGETGLARKAIANGLKTIYDPGLKLFHDVPQSRLTIDYFKRRAFYQGVCNSYSDIRAQYEKGQYVTEVVKPALRKRLQNKLRHIYRLLKTKFGFDKSPTDIPDDVKQIKEMLVAEEKAGYKFHQAAFINEKEVKQWVLKENYWNYQLPANS